jgi:hypothetical protein
MSRDHDAQVEPANRADLAEALARLLRADEVLAGAVAVNEAWAMGYIAQLLVHAEVLAAQSSNDVYQAVTTSADAATREALFNANPKLVFDRWHDPIPGEVTAGLLALLDAQAQFHRAAVVLERRGLRREPPRY